MGRFRLLLAAFCIVFVGVVYLRAAITPEQRQKVIATAGAINRLDQLLKANKFDEALKLLPDIQNAATELAAIPEMAEPVKNLVKRIDSARGLLELQGITVPEFVKPTAPTPGEKGKNAPAGNAVGGVSFVKQVAPFLIAKCGNCHVTGSKGQLNFATYEIIERGFMGKLLIQKGDSKNSEGVREIENGNMPRGGLKVTPDELAMFKKWIDEGAKFDGANAKAPLGQLAMTAGVKTAPQEPVKEAKLEVMSATGRETVSFARDIAPILVDQCYDCHGGGRRDSGGLGLETFTELLKGGESGNALVPGKPADSLLVKKIKGTAGERMPMGRKPLSDPQIALIDKWVAEGAKYDAGDVNVSLGMMVRMLQAKNATHEKLMKERDESARVYWKQAMPDDAAQTIESKSFLVMGNVGEAQLKEISALAEAQAATLAPQFKLPADKPWIKGRATIFVLKRRFEYAEWKNNENREIPTALRGHIRHNLIDAYGVMWVPSDPAEFSLKSLVNEQVNGLLVGEAGGGKLPSWFSGGVGRALAARSDTKDIRYKELDGAIAGAIAATQVPAELARGNLSGERAEVLAYGFAKYLLSGGTKFNGLITAVQGGQDFDAALTRNFGGNAGQLLSTWTGKSMTAKP